MVPLNDREPRVLIVEQNEYHGLLMERQLSRRLDGSEIVLTQSPDEAIRFVRSQRFDVAVVDFVMADCDGPTLVKSLHQVSPELAIIVVAEDLTEAITREIFNSGCDELLIKDSSFYAVIPRLVAGLIHRLRISQQESINSKRRVFSDMDRAASRLLRKLQGELDSSIDAILEVAEEIIDNNALSDSELKQQVSSIHESALQIRSSLSALTSHGIAARKAMEFNRLADTESPHPRPKIPVKVT